MGRGEGDEDEVAWDQDAESVGGESSEVVQIAGAVHLDGAVGEARELGGGEHGVIGRGVWRVALIVWAQRRGIARGRCGPTG